MLMGWNVNAGTWFFSSSAPDIKKTGAASYAQTIGFIVFSSRISDSKGDSDVLVFRGPVTRSGMFLVSLKRLQPSGQIIPDQIKFRFSVDEIIWETPSNTETDAISIDSAGILVLISNNLNGRPSRRGLATVNIPVDDVEKAIPPAMLSSLHRNKYLFMKVKIFVMCLLPGTEELTGEYMESESICIKIET
jgi:hypothetical protein